MHHLRASTKGILKRVEERTGKSIQFMRDERLSLLATLQMARNGADFHVLRYRLGNEPFDYTVAFQAGFVLLFENAPSRRFDFAPSPTAGQQVEPLLATGQADEQSKTVAQDPRSARTERDALADALLFLVRLSSELGIDLNEAVAIKVASNAQKYPAGDSTPKRT